MDTQATTETKTKKPAPTGELRMDAAIFHRLARTVLHAVSTDPTRAHLNSLHIVSSAIGLPGQSFSTDSTEVSP